MKKHVCTIGFALLLSVFTVYVVLDTFVLGAVYDGNASKVNNAMFEEKDVAAKELPSSDAEEKITMPNEKSTVAADFQNENITIVLSEYERYNTKIHVAEVWVASAEYLKTALANNAYGKNISEKTSSIAKNNGAVLAINGDNYGSREKGYVIRNGIVYRDAANGSEVLCLYADGTMEVVSDREFTAEELVGKGVWQAFSFGPALIENGKITVTENDEVGKAMASNPRTAMGWIDVNHYVFVVSDGRTRESEGLSLYELAEFLEELGVQTAYNLDGGGSSTMYFNGKVINNPTTNGRIKERGVTDIVYVGDGT